MMAEKIRKIKAQANDLRGILGTLSKSYGGAFFANILKKFSIKSLSEIFYSLLNTPPCVGVSF